MPDRFPVGCWLTLIGLVLAVVAVAMLVALLAEKIQLPVP